MEMNHNFSTIHKFGFAQTFFQIKDFKKDRILVIYEKNCKIFPKKKDLENKVVNPPSLHSIHLRAGQEFKVEIWKVCSGSVWTVLLCLLAVSWRSRTFFCGIFSYSYLGHPEKILRTCLRLQVCCCIFLAYVRRHAGSSTGIYSVLRSKSFFVDAIRLCLGMLAVTVRFGLGSHQFGLKT